MAHATVCHTQKKGAILHCVAFLASPKHMSMSMHMHQSMSTSMHMCGYMLNAVRIGWQHEERALVHERHLRQSIQAACVEVLGLRLHQHLMPALRNLVRLRKQRPWIKCGRPGWGIRRNLRT